MHEETFPLRKGLVVLFMQKIITKSLSKWRGFFYKPYSNLSKGEGAGKKTYIYKNKLYLIFN